MTLPLIFVLIAACALSGGSEQSRDPTPAWVQRLDGCYLDSKGRLGQEGIAALSSREVAVYCVTRNPNAPPGLSRRSGAQTSDPYQVNVFFLDNTDGHVLQKASWPTRAGTQTDIFPVNDHFFLLVAGNAIQLIDRATLSTVHRLANADPMSGCDSWKVIGSMDGMSFGVSHVCDVDHIFASEITAYRTIDFQKIAFWKNEGLNFYGVFDHHLLRWSTEHRGSSNEIVFYTPGLRETILRGTTFVVSKSIFLDGQTVLCCRGSNWLRVLRIDGQEMAYLNFDPNHNSSDPKVLADQIFASRTGQLIGALVFHVPWAGSLHWECNVFDRSLHPLLRITVPVYHNDVTAVFSPDDKYVFVLRDANVSAYSIPQSANP
ncbi:MAG: hypothetical protein WBX22_26300 [Silvibacterium sp.]